MFRTRFEYWRVFLLVLTLALPLSAQAQDDKAKKEKKTPTGTPVFWTDPTDIASRNLLLGAGGEEMKPDVSKLTFIEQKTGASQLTIHWFQPLVRLLRRLLHC